MMYLKLEGHLMKMWSTSDDIEMLFGMVVESEELDRNELENALLGLYTLHNIRSRLAFEFFELCLKEGVFNEPRISAFASKAVEALQGSDQGGQKKGDGGHANQDDDQRRPTRNKKGQGAA